MVNEILPRDRFWRVLCLKHKPIKPFNSIFKDKLKKLEIEVKKNKKNWEIFAKNRCEEVRFWRLQSRVENLKLKIKFRKDDVNSIPENIQSELLCNFRRKFVLSRTGFANLMPPMWMSFLTDLQLIYASFVIKLSCIKTGVKSYTRGENPFQDSKQSLMCHIYKKICRREAGL